MAVLAEGGFDPQRPVLSGHPLDGILHALESDGVRTVLTLMIIGGRKANYCWRNIAGSDKLQCGIHEEASLKEAHG